MVHAGPHRDGQNKRRESARVAGWLAVVSGAAAVVAAVLSENRAIDLAGAYGLLFVLTGGWAVVGLGALATATVSSRTGALGR